MKIIFLDIDGVLNHELHYREMSQDNRFKKVGLPLCNINNDTVEILNDLTDETGAKIVLSSTWRYGKTLDELKFMFKSFGITGDFIGKIPVIKLILEWWRPAPRGLEIQCWLDHYEPKERVIYVIFDDDTDMLYQQRDNFFHVDNFCGLTPTICDRAKTILNRGQNERSL